MKRQKQKRTTGLIIAVVALLALIITVVAYSTSKKSAAPQTSASPSPSITKGNSTQGEPSSSPTAATTPAPRPSQSTVTLAKPTLQKSSGNAPGSSVPSGAIVEFSCEGTEGLACGITLTDRNAPSRVLKLDKKTITNNGRGQYFAIFDWTAVSGSWKVVAEVNDQSGNSAVSDAQTLEVK
jgi:hypothetical protein